MPNVTVLPLMHGSTSPLKNGCPACSQRHWSLTSATARRTRSEVGSTPKSCSSWSVGSVDVQGWPWPSSRQLRLRAGKHAPPAHWPSSPCNAINLAPQPSVATRARSAATTSAGACTRSRSTCQRMAGSESSSQSSTVMRLNLGAPERVREAGQQRLYGLDARGLRPMQTGSSASSSSGTSDPTDSTNTSRSVRRRSLRMASGASAGPTTDREFVVSRVIEGPRRIVFDAFSSVASLDRWWSQNGTTHAFEFRPGGVWEFTVPRDGKDFPNYVVWKEIVPPERIVWTYSNRKDDPHAVESILTLAERGAETEVTLLLVFGSKEMRDQAAQYGAVEGAQQTLDLLAAAVAERR